MKKIFASLFFIPLITDAQNVGIGTALPAGRLQINHRSGIVPGLLFMDSAVNRSGSLQFRNINNSRGITVSGFTNSDFYNGQFLDIQTDSILVATFQGNGNVGIKNGNPLFPLDISGTTNINGLLRIPGLNLMEFGAGIPAKEINAGKVGYNAFGQNALTFVGAGSNITNRAIYFFAEGGTTMNGPLGFNGPLRVNGNPGTAGQVLTSNGTGTAGWTNTAYSNDIRFAFSFIQNASSANGEVRITNTRYNLNTTAVTTGANSITINRSGLYHFEAQVFTEYGFPVTPSTGAPLFNFTFYTGTLASNAYPLVTLGQMQGSGAQYRIAERQSIDLYISAPATIRLNHSFSNADGGFIISMNGVITGYLLAE